MNAVVRPISSTPAADRLAATHDQIASLNADFNDRASRVRALEQMLSAVDGARGNVDRLREQRRVQAGKQIAASQRLNVAAIDREIASATKALAAAEQELSKLDGADSVRSALEYLAGEQQAVAASLKSLSDTLPELGLAVLDEKMAQVAPIVATHLAQVVADFKELVRMTLERNRIAAGIPGSRQLQCSLDFTLFPPTLEAFRGLGGRIDLRPQQ